MTMVASAARNDDRTDRAVALVERALQSVFREDQGKITASTETDVQNALLILRSGGSDAEILCKVEHISTLLFSIMQAQRAGRPNLSASMKLRLRRFAFS